MPWPSLDALSHTTAVSREQCKNDSPVASGAQLIHRENRHQFEPLALEVFGRAFEAVYDGQDFLNAAALLPNGLHGLHDRAACSGDILEQDHRRTGAELAVDQLGGAVILHGLADKK